MSRSLAGIATCCMVAAATEKLTSFSLNFVVSPCYFSSIPILLSPCGSARGFGEIMELNDDNLLALQAICKQ